MALSGVLVSHRMENSMQPEAKTELLRCGRIVEGHLAYGKQIANRKDSSNITLDINEVIQKLVIWPGDSLEGIRINF